MIGVSRRIFIFINCKNKMSNKYNGRGTLYAAYPFIENMTSFI